MLASRLEPLLKVLLGLGIGLAGACPVVAGESVLLVGGDFEAGLAPWTQFASDGSTPFSIQPSPSGQGSVAGCDLPAEMQASLELHRPLAAGEFMQDPPTVGELGPPLEFGIWAWLDPSVTSGQVWLTLEDFDGRVATPIGGSPTWDVASLPKARWVYLATTTVGHGAAQVASDAVELRYRVHCTVRGPICFDGARVRYDALGEIPVPEGNFEDWKPASSAWESSGALSAGPSIDTPRGYYGPGFAIVEGTGAGLLSRTLSLAGSPESAPPEVVAGSFVEAGLWVHFDGFAPLPQVPNSALHVRLDLFGVHGETGAKRLLAREDWRPTAADLGDWKYLETNAVSLLSPKETALRIELGKSIQGRLAVDFVQLGELGGIDGNARRRVGASYVGRYRNPNYPGATTQPTSPQEIWRNWRWVMPPACNNSFVGFRHDPDCTSSATCFRPNGRRDLAISDEESLHNLPLIGAYDSRDKAVVRYHMELAESAGIDHFIFDHQGELLAQQLIAQGREPINSQTFDALLEVAEEPERDLKLAVMYEPKVHFLGWVLGEPTQADKVLGIARDLSALASQLGGKRSTLRTDDRLVVFLFRNKICNPDGTQCLDASDWSWIHQYVLNQTGEDLFFVGDMAPDLDSPIQGFTRWQLVNRNYLRYRSYSDAQLGTPTQPTPALATLQNHSRGLTNTVMDWRNRDALERVAVQTVWPGFDDGGVAGWGMPNLTGEDGQPLCVRIAEGFAGEFYSTTVLAALDSTADWIQIATFNDWNEQTRIEPAWNPNYLGPLAAGSTSSAIGQSRVYGRMIETRQWIAAFKGYDSGKPGFRQIANRYFAATRRDPELPIYD